VNYEANFKTDGKTMSALYDENGNRQETETDITISNLPAAVTDYISQKYKGEKIKEAAIITKANGEVNYEAEVNGMDLLFTKDGKFIKEAKD
ncbi:MAG TPA: PepSY-like domain-containing protein, partial [Hanamia sp.]|nr:PepSY-like domain-containing protein [Hanamia sp.]